MQNDSLQILFSGSTFAAVEKQFYASCIDLIGENTVIVGIRTGGDTLADRLAEYITNLGKKRPDVGYLDITLYRDDYGHREHFPTVQETQIPVDLDGRDVLLIDEVLFTGRTIRSALDALNEFGRPSSVRLAALFDRGCRELPIQADAVGAVMQIDRDASLLVEFNNDDNIDRAISVST